MLASAEFQTAKVNIDQLAKLSILLPLLPEEIILGLCVVMLVTGMMSMVGMFCETTALVCQVLKLVLLKLCHV